MLDRIEKMIFSLVSGRAASFACIAIGLLILLAAALGSRVPLLRDIPVGSEWVIPGIVTLGAGLGSAWKTLFLRSDLRALQRVHNAGLLSRGAYESLQIVVTNNHFPTGNEVAAANVRSFLRWLRAVDPRNVDKAQIDRLSELVAEWPGPTT